MRDAIHCTEIRREITILVCWRRPWRARQRRQLLLLTPSFGDSQNLMRASLAVPRYYKYQVLDFFCQRCASVTLSRMRRQQLTNCLTSTVLQLQLHTSTSFHNKTVSLLLL